jgi:hypothetical protein
MRAVAGGDSLMSPARRPLRLHYTVQPQWWVVW